MTRRFLIVRLSAIGDTVHAIPLAAALKRLYPDCRLGWVVEKPSAALVVGNPLVDWTHVLPRGWLKNWRAIIDLRSALAAERFDVAFDVQGLTKSAIAAMFSRAPIRIGFTRGESRELAPILDNRLVEPTKTHIVDKVLELLTGIDAEPPPAEFRFPPCPDNNARAIDAFLAESAMGDGFVLAAPWSSAVSKCWPMERVAGLAEALLAEHGLKTAVLGHGAERAAVLDIAKTRAHCLALAPELTLPGVVELARRARLCVSADSFAMHAAAAAGTPTVGLFAVTDPARLGPYGRLTRVAAKELKPMKSRERKRAGQERMGGLDSAYVAGVAGELLKEAAGV